MRPRLSYANVVASIALFIALGGTSYAITKLPKNSVGSTQVRDGSLQRQDLGAGVVSAATRGPRGSEGPRGSVGSEGPRGPEGLRGLQGERGPASVRIARQAANIALTGLGGQQTQVRRMDNLAAGAWVLRFDANAYLNAPTALHAFCAIKLNGDQKAVGAVVVGENPNAVLEVGIAVETAVQQPTPFNVTVDCYQSINSSPAATIVRPQIIATQVAEVITTP